MRIELPKFDGTIMFDPPPKSTIQQFVGQMLEVVNYIMEWTRRMMDMLGLSQRQPTKRMTLTLSVGGHITLVTCNANI